MNPNAASFIRLVKHPLKFRVFLFLKLPSAFFSGVRVRDISREKCVVSVPYKWFSQNPFRSTYFACLSMAAEMSTGVLAMAQVYKRTPVVSMLVIKTEATYSRKATGRTLFTCLDGEAMSAVIETCARSGEPATFVAFSKGTDEKGETVAAFYITWSFKAKTNKI